MVEWEPGIQHKIYVGGREFPMPDKDDEMERKDAENVKAAESFVLRWRMGATAEGGLPSTERLLNEALIHLVNVRQAYVRSREVCAAKDPEIERLQVQFALLMDGESITRHYAGVETPIRGYAPEEFKEALETANQIIDAGLKAKIEVARLQAAVCAKDSVLEQIHRGLHRGDRGEDLGCSYPESCVVAQALSPSAACSHKEEVARLETAVCDWRGKMVYWRNEAEIAQKRLGDERGMRRMAEWKLTHGSVVYQPVEGYRHHVGDALVECPDPRHAWKPQDWKEVGAREIADEARGAK